MPTTLKIDFVSDVSCPWCAIGLTALLQAIDRVKDEVTVYLRCQPFELNPRMAPGGQDITEHLTDKYGSTPEQQAQIRDMIRQVVVTPTEDRGQFEARARTGHTDIQPAKTKPSPNGRSCSAERVRSLLKL